MRFARLAALVIAVSTTVFAPIAPAVASAAAHSPAGLSAPCCGMRLHAHLSGSAAYPSAHGSADYQRNCCHREFTVTVGDISSLAGQTLAVWANGAKAGTATVSSGGSFFFHRSGSGVPRLAPGDKVTVKRPTGTLVASGTLRRRMCC
jgi:hypothetical protein